LIAEKKFALCCGQLHRESVCSMIVDVSLEHDRKENENFPT